MRAFPHFILLVVAGVAAPAPAAKLPPCPPKHAQLFVAPMGEPFRAAADAPYPAAAWFARVDADRDGRVTLAEMRADADRWFAALDLDHDGQLLPDEVSAYERMVPEIALYARRPPGEKAARPAKPKKGANPYDVPLGAGRWAWLNIPEPVSGADADYDRAVTRDEFRAAAAARFARLDKGGLGYLSLDRLPRTPAQAEAIDCDPTRPPPKPKPER